MLLLLSGKIWEIREMEQNSFISCKNSLLKGHYGEKRNLSMSQLIVWKNTSPLI